MEHTPTPTLVTERPENIPGYTYGTDEAAETPLNMLDLQRLKAVVGLTQEDQRALADAVSILADQADDMVTAYRGSSMSYPS